MCHLYANSCDLHTSRVIVCDVVLPPQQTAHSKETLSSLKQISCQITLLRTRTASLCISVQIAVLIKVLIEAFHNEIVQIKCRIFSDSEHQ